MPHTGPLAPAEYHDHMQDTVLHGVVAPLARAAGVARAARTYLTDDGQRVEVQVSSDYPADFDADQALVDFLGSRVHGQELSSLRVYVGTPAEIQTICGGPRAVACYAIDQQRMFVPGERVHGVPVEYALTHEYGHHVAGWRDNNPWDAIDWGAKHWASEMRVCTHVARGRLFPGNQGEHYLEDPGEGFADGFAHLHYEDAPWQFSPLLRPTSEALAAIRRDVLRPWTGPRSRTFRGRLGLGRSPRSFKLRLTLDGDMSIRLRAARGVSAEVEVDAGRFATGQTLRGGGGFGIEWCRRQENEKVTLTVRRREGSGPFALKVSYPG